MSFRLPRRRWLQAAAGGTSAWAFGGAGSSPAICARADSPAGLQATGFFTVGRRGDHWWFFTPGGEPFFSIGMNHIDSATLRYEENRNIWDKRYANSQKQWLTEAVGPDLRRWGFNCVGWTQEVVVRGATIHRHSRPFDYEQYQWLDMPYCHLLPFAEIHQWEVETRYPDVFSPEFADWCDYVARDHCVRMADDPKLIGYFYSDCPAWVHAPTPELKGPWFDPQRLSTPAGRRQLHEMARQYYRLLHDSIRRYDPNHLILGDRYEAKRPVPEEVLTAAKPYVDVLSFQYFGRPEEIVPDFERWHALTGLPVLLADASVPGARPGVPSSEYADNYEPMIRALRETPCCVGWHLCGAYLENTARGRGLRNRQNEIDRTLVEAIGWANRQTARWVGEVAAR